MKSDQPTNELTSRTAAGSDPAFGLFVVWPAGRTQDLRVLERLAAAFDILDVTEAVWTPELTAAAYARFYQARMVPPHRPSLLEVRGVGAALVVAVLDPKPAWVGLDSHLLDRRDRVNRRFAEARDGLADLVGAGPLHAAENAAQAVREYMLLLERDAAQAVRRGAWDGRVDRLERDLAGTGGWTDVRHMFRVLNTGAPYVVLRNYEGLAELDFLPGHTDIDILTSDYVQTISLLGAESRIRSLPRWGGRFDVVIGSGPVICDLRFPGDQYYEPAWAREILRTRRPHRDGFYVPDPDELLDTLLYHAVVHKPEVRPDYQVRLAELARDRSRTGWEVEALANRTTSQQILDDRLAARGYSVRRPKDPTVFFNNRLQRPVAPILWRAADALRRRAYRFAMRYIRYPLRFGGLTIVDLLERPVALLRSRLKR